MMIRVTAAVLAALVCTACGGSIDNHEDAAMAGMDIMEEMIDILDKVNDKESAKEASDALKDLTERAKELGEQARALPAQTPEERNAIAKKLKPRMQKMTPKLMAALQKFQQYPELEKAFQSVSTEMGKMK